MPTDKPIITDEVKREISDLFYEFLMPGNEKFILQMRVKVEQKVADLLARKERDERENKNKIYHLFADAVITGVNPDGNSFNFEHVLSRFEEAKKIYLTQKS